MFNLIGNKHSGRMSNIDYRQFEPMPRGVQMAMNASRKIMLIEDDELFREAMVDFLSDQYTTMTAETAEEGLRHLANGTKPDVILLDINLPGMNGIECLREIKLRHLNIPVIMVSANDHTPEIVTSIKLGAFDYLVKPVAPDRLIATIERALAG